MALTNFAFKLDYTRQPPPRQIEAGPMVGVPMVCQWRQGPTRV